MTRSPILPVSELAERMASETGVVLLDARAKGYDSGHLHGAQRANLETQLSAAKEEGANPAHGGRHPLPTLARWTTQLGQWGIGPQTDVVLYDDQSGANAAARAWWMLRSVGHERVAVLDGGFGAALAAGLPVTTEVPTVEVQPPYPATAWQRPIVDLQGVDALRQHDAWMVLDVRSPERYRGETEPIDPVAGHIHGAVNLPFAENLDHGRFKSPTALRAMYEELLGAIPIDHLIVHCGSGVTACHTLLALEAAGLEGASLYVGSWGEWCRQPE